jgi:predicted DNA-binding antitoxin AbrB/MazE fold protein
MPVVKATYDGQVFVPSEPVEVPEGTPVEVIVPPRKPTEEEKKEWQEMLAQIRANDSPEPLGPMTPEQLATWEELKKYITATEPVFRTVEEAISYSRKRP